MCVLTYCNVHNGNNSHFCCDACCTLCIVGGVLHIPLLYDGDFGAGVNYCNSVAGSEVVVAECCLKVAQHWGNFGSIGETALVVEGVAHSEAHGMQSYSVKLFAHAGSQSVHMH